MVMRIESVPSPSSTFTEHLLQMCYGAAGSHIPGQSHGKAARAPTEPFHLIPILRQLEHALGQRAPVTMRDQVPRDPVLHRLPQAWAVRGKSGRAARGCLDVGNSPSFLRTRKHHRPRPAQQTALLVLGHEPKKARRVTETELVRHLLDASSVAQTAAAIGALASTNAVVPNKWGTIATNGRRVSVGR